MTSPLHAAFCLLVLFQVKHFLADFPLQFAFMLQKKVSKKWDFVIPLGLHCLVHASLTLGIVFLFRRYDLWWLALVDFATHFVMDRIKSGPRYLGRFSDMHRSSFWYALGFDQMVHHLTHYWIVWVLVTWP